MYKHIVTHMDRPQVLDWQPRVSVREGLAKVVEYFRRELEETGNCTTSYFTCV